MTNVGGLPLLSLWVLVPWAGAVLLALGRGLHETAVRRLGVLFSASTALLALLLVGRFHPALTGLQLVEDHAWIPGLGVRFKLGLDGLALVLVLLTAVVSPACLLASRPLAGQRAYAALFLLLQGAVLGSFLAADFFPWFLCWELSLVPAFFLIRLWGGPHAGPAAYQFIVYTLAGSVLLLLGFAAVYAACGLTDFESLARLARAGELDGRLALLGGAWPKLAFFGILAGLAVKVPLFPLHTWLPPAYTEAPTGTVMFLTAVMSKMGLYGLLRILWPLFPALTHAAASWLLLLAVAGAVFGAWAALQQTDFKRMLAYSSINHLAYCLMALFAVFGAPIGSLRGGSAGDALGGVLVQMVAHGLSAAALFACAGYLETRAGGKRGLGDFGGVRTAAPLLAGLCGLSLFASLGLPGLNGFVGEFLIFRGVFAICPAAAAIALLGLLATAVFLLTFWQRVFHGPQAGAGAGMADLRAWEAAPLVPLAALMVILGVAPGLLTALFNPLVAAWAAHF